MSRLWQVGDIVERQTEPRVSDGFALQTTAMVSAVQVASSSRFDTVRWVSLGPWFEYKTQQQLEELGWKLVEPKVLIPPDAGGDGATSAGGREVSEPWIQTFGGIEVGQTQYNHPSITSGQHTNGPMSIWVRVPGGEWVPTHCRTMQEVRFWCEEFGAQYIQHLEGAK